MFGFELSGTVAAVTTIFIIVGMLTLFIREVYPPEVTAILGAVVLLGLGILDIDSIAGVLSNPAPLDHRLLMFIIVGGLVRTGRARLDRAACRAACGCDHPFMTLASISVVVCVLSGFVNNTPLVVVMMPIFMQLAKEMGKVALQAADPIVISVHFGRNDDNDRYIDKPAGRWRRAQLGDGCVLDLRDYPGRPADGDYWV